MKSNSMDKASLKHILSQGLRGAGSDEEGDTGSGPSVGDGAVPDEPNPVRVSALDRLLDEADKIRGQLERTVLGQPAAVERLLQAWLATELMGSSSDGPAGVFLFIGPPGVGRTLAARQLATASGNRAFLELDLSQITHQSQTASLMGSEPSFSEAAPGQLTSFVAKNPEAVVMFKNIERCHPLVLAKLNDVLETGQMKDLYGLDSDGDKASGSHYQVSFSRAILIFSTTAGESVWGEPSFQATVQSNPTHAEFMLLDALAQLKSAVDSAGDDDRPQFSSAMLNQWRGGRTVLFRDLPLEVLVSLAQRSVEARLSQLSVRLDVELEGASDQLLLQAILLSQAPRVGAQEAANVVPQELMSRLIGMVSELRLESSDLGFRVGDSVRLQLKELSERLLHARPNSCLLDEFRRRGLKLALEWQQIPEQGAVELASIRTEQVKSGEDISGAGAISVQIPAIGFEQIAGHQLIKMRLREVVQLLKDAERPNVRPLIPAGMLLYGPPGTGKTMLAKALAHEAELPFLSTTGTELLNPNMTRLVFARARKYAPSIIFIDEVDALGSREQGGNTVAINQLLAEMDGFSSGQSGMVFVIAATNIRDTIDPAIKRPGRLDLHLEVPSLDADARRYFVDKMIRSPGGGDLGIICKTPPHGTIRASLVTCREPEPDEAAEPCVWV